MKKARSWVWKYAHRENDTAYCDLCDDKSNNEFSCRGGSTGSTGHLQNMHDIAETTNVSSSKKRRSDDLTTDELQDNHPSPSKRSKFRKRLPSNGSVCSPDRAEEIHQALAKMIAVNQMPISFCSSEGFLEFMSVVQPGYKPIQDEVLKKRLQALKTHTESIIKAGLNKASGVSCTSDCWTSAAQDSYMTMTVHFINDDWIPQSFTLDTLEMDERHTAENLRQKMSDIFERWNIDKKIVAVVTDNAANVVKAIKSMYQVEEKYDLTCAVHSLQLEINKALSQQDIKLLINKASKVVGHFKYFNNAKYALEEKQKQLGLPVLSLLQSCITRWNSVFLMLERLIRNRSPVMNVLMDRKITISAIAEKLEISESEWTDVDNLVEVLRSIYMVTQILCSEDCPTSTVRPIMYKLLVEHMKPLSTDTKIIKNLKSDFSKDIKNRLYLEWDLELSTVSTRQIASMLDPRYKDLDHEDHDAKAAVRSAVRDMLEENISEAFKNQIASDSKKQTALKFLYKKSSTDNNNKENQWQAFLAEPQLKFDTNPFEWWKAKKDKYPGVALLARKFLCIPATSVSSERCFSTAGNIVTYKRASLHPNNVNMLVFLYQNRSSMKKVTL